MATKNVIIKRWTGSVWDEIYPKTTAENIISGILNDARIPNLSASKITSGTFDAARIPSLSASKITSDTFDAARIPNLDASKITSGTIDAARLPAIAITDVTVDTTMTHFLTLYSPDPSVMQKGDVLILTTDNKTFIHNGGVAGTIADFNQMATPTDVVTSVAGKTGAVTLVPGDVGLGNVTNESKATMFASPTFTGTPLSTTATKGTNTTQIATTAFVQTAIGDYVPKTTKVNNKALSGDISITASDVGLGSVTNNAQMKKIASSTDGYIPTWSGNAGDTLGTGYAISGTGSVAMTNSPTFTGTPNIGTGSNTWTITDTTPDELKFINGGTVVLPKVATGTKTIAFEEDVQSAITLTASRAVISGTDGKLAASSVTSAEIGRLSGLTVNVQTGKQHSIQMGLSSALPASSTFNGDIYLQTD